MDVYSRRTGTPHAAEIRTTVTSERGERVLAKTEERRTEEIKAKSGRFGHTAQFPLAAFAPGRYVLRVEATALVSGGTTAARELEFRVR